MRPLFPRWANSVFVVALVAGALLLLGLPTMLMLFQRTPFVTGQFRSVAQPVDFDHRHHVGDDGIDCLYCHDLAERSSTAGVPPTSRCLGCHGQIWNGSPLLDAVWKSRQSGRPIPWVRVHRLPGFVYFDHSAHVNHGVGCVTCHGRVDRMARVYQAEPLTMGWCIDCHRDPGPRLRPASELTSQTWSPAPTQRAALARRLMKEYDVQAGTSCTTCHR